VNRAISEALREGDVFAVFPEGTTTDGSTLGRFHSSLLEPAVAAGALVVPAALRFARTDGSLATEAAYIGDTPLWDTVKAMTAQPGIDIHLWLLEPLDAAGLDRRELAQRARDAISLTLYPEALRTRTERAAGRRDAVH
jgi:1-acyl-sn-glycerol-3-phosphate acyltransferase